jgi:hypothetical protein
LIRQRQFFSLPLDRNSLRLQTLIERISIENIQYS